MIEVKIIGPNGVIEPVVTETNSSKFKVDYLAQHHGDYKISIFIFGRDVLGNPITVSFKDSDVPNIYFRYLS